MVGLARRRRPTLSPALVSRIPRLARKVLTCQDRRVKKPNTSMLACRVWDFFALSSRKANASDDLYPPSEILEIL